MRRPRLLAALVAFDLLVVAALLLWRPWDGGDSGWSERTALRSVPSGAVLGSVRTTAEMSGSAGDGVAVVLAEDGATFSTGRWIGISAVPAEDGVDPDSVFPGEARSAAQVGDSPAALGTTYDGRAGLVVGPVDGRLLAVVGQGVSDDELSAVAASVTVDESGRPVVDDGTLDGAVAATLDGRWDVLGSVSNATTDVTSSVLGALLLPGPGGSAVVYQPTAGSVPLQLANRPAPQDDADPLVRFVLGDPRPVTVHGVDALAGEVSLPGYTFAAVVWQEHGRRLSLSGPAPADGLLAAADEVVELDTAGWEALQAQAAGR